MSQDQRILVIGSLNYDIILKQERLPRLGETYTVDGVTTGGGGKGANQAVQCAKMGAKTAMFGAVGKDLYGDYLCSQLAGYGVETRHIRRTDESTGLGINNVLPDGSLYANIVRGANYALVEEDITRLEDEISKSSIVILQLEIPLRVVERAIQVARRHDCYVILNAAPALPLPDSALCQVDCLIVNENEASYYAGKAIEGLQDALAYCEVLRNKVRDLLIITLGENGSLLYNGKEKTYIPARRVRAVDTTGAGDSYIGVFAAKLNEGRPYLEAGIYATLAASITITAPGSQVAMPRAEEVETLYRRESMEPMSCK